MSTLIVTLPLLPAGSAPEYSYALTPDGHALARHGEAPAALLPLPSRSGEIVAVVPAQALSWHRVELPKGTTASSPRLRAVLDGLLEECLLDEPENLHFALEPLARAGAPVWVAVCSKAWLRAALQALEAAERPVSRIVPEFSPGVAPLPRVHVTGTPETAQLVITGAQADRGVTVLPLTPAAVALAQSAGSWPDATEVLAEPGVAALAEQLLGRKISLQQSAQRWLESARTPWDLAQLELANSSRSRALKRLATVWRELLRAPQWRAARWGAAALLIANLLGLNAWAWKEKSALDQKQSEIRKALTQTFPAVKAVVDAPLQMEREVAALRQAAGTASGRDLEAILGALSTAAPANRSLSAIEFIAGEARIRGLDLSAQEAAGVAAALQAQGYAARTEGDALLVKPEAGR